MPADNARLKLLQHTLKLRMEQRAEKADVLRKLKAAASGGNAKAGKEFEAHLDSVMGKHFKDTYGNYLHKSPVIINSKPLTAGQYVQARTIGNLQNDNRTGLRNTTASVHSGGKFTNTHSGEGMSQIAKDRREATINRAIAGKAKVHASRQASGLTRSQIVKKAWETRHKYALGTH